ncbi:MAG: phage portal protein, partial [Marinilabiliales bacterium]
GVPWMYSALLQLHKMGKFEDAALLAALIGASKMGFYQEMGGDNLIPDDSRIDEAGNFIQKIEAGEFGVVPSGYEFKDFNPNYPDAQVGPFLKSMLRGVASGLGVSYHSLANDLESVNFSSARAGVLEERDQWMMLQEWLKEHFHEPVFELWLSNSCLTKKLPFSLDRLDKLSDVYFQGKRWPWVDPLKDVNANIAAIKNGLKSRSAVVNESGSDIEDVFDQLAMETDLAADKGLTISETPNASPESEVDEDEEETA